MEKAKITSKGQVTIPKEIREELGVAPGDEIVFVARDGKATIAKEVESPVAEMRKLRKKIRITEKDLERMIKESKKEWDRF